MPEENQQVKEALELADENVLVGRERRLKRAIDLSFKWKSLLDYTPDIKLEPFKKEIYPMIKKIQARDEEHVVLNAHKK